MLAIPLECRRKDLCQITQLFSSLTPLDIFIHSNYNLQLQFTKIYEHQNNNKNKQSRSRTRKVILEEENKFKSVENLDT